MLNTAVISQLMLRIRHDVQPKQGQKIVSINEVLENFSKTSVEIDRLIAFAPLNRVDSLLAGVVAMLKLAMVDDNIGRGGLWRTSRRCIELLSLVNAQLTED